MRISTFSGQQLAQMNNPDPFATPVWRSPVYHTPGWLITLVQLVRLLWALARFLARHPLLDLAVVVLTFAWSLAGWPGPLVLVVAAAAVLSVWRWRWPGSFSRLIAGPARCRWRRWHYRRHWIAVMTVASLAVIFRGRMLLPVLGKVIATRYTDRVLVGLVSGQSVADFADRAENLAHGFGALLCRVRTATPGFVVLEFVRSDALAGIIPALPTGQQPDLTALLAGRCEDGTLWRVKLHGTHVLIAGATGAGKGSIIWSLVRALLPAMLSGLVQVLAADPKVMELAYGRAIFDTCGGTPPIPRPSPTCSTRPSQACRPAPRSWRANSARILPRPSTRSS